MKNLYILKYNNYYNRIIKKHDTWVQYNQDSEATLVFTQSNCNFNPNDGMETKHIIGKASGDTSAYNGTGDYLLVLGTGASSNVEQRWFIIDHKRTKGGQYELTLRRDIIADYYNSVVTAPMIVNRAMISDQNNPLLFNPEGFKFNQIKQNEILLQDKTKMPWYILYFKLNTPSMTVQFSTANISWDVDSSVDATSSSSMWKSGTYYNTSGWKFKFDFNPSFDIEGRRVIDQFQVPDYVLSNVQSYGPSNTFIWFSDDRYTVSSKLANAFTNSVYENTLVPTANTLYYGSNLKSDEAVAEYNKYNGQTFILRTTVQNVTNYYKVSVNVTKTKKTGIITENTTLYSTIKGIIDNNNIGYTGSLGSHALEYEYYENKIVIDTTSYVAAGSYNISLTLQSYANCIDAPYYIMAVPMYDLDVEKADSTRCLSHQLDSQMFVNAVIKAAGETNLLDVQILPYFPYISKIPNGSIYPTDEGIEIDIFNQFPGQTPEFVDYLNSRQVHSFYRTGDANYGVNVFFIDTANFTFDINQTLAIPSRTADPALNKKLSNELDVYRLCSPNYNGMFEFSVAKNNNVSSFNVDCTLKPYTPYIHINPAFDSIYGQDFNDARGLICQGDFSIPIVNDLWVQYEYQNKNYLNTFNRQIEHMDFQHGQERTRGLVGAITGTAQGAISGATAGAMASGMNPVGAAVGGVVGGVTALAGGIADYAMMGARQREDKDFAIDNFKFQLGNIQALPYNINKVTCLTFNNKLWPFIEYYSATAEEASILQNKITYNSMTVNAVGSIIEYQKSVRTFISGELIRLEGTDLSNHEVYEIYDELKKGVYI